MIVAVKMGYLDRLINFDMYLYHGNHTNHRDQIVFA